MRLRLTICLLLLCLLGSAQPFDFNANCRKAYEAVLALKLSEAGNLLKTEKNNAITPYLQDYIDFTAIYISDSRSLYEQRIVNREPRMEMLKNADKNSPWYLFTQAEVQLHWAALGIRFGDYVTSVFSIRRAYKLLEDNRNKYPDFTPNNKSFGVIEALIGSVPDKYHWAVNMLGMEGSVNGGLKKLADLVENSKKSDYIFKDETVIYYAFLLFHLQNEKEKAWQVLRAYGFPKAGNLMSVYSCAHIGIYGKHNEEALQLLTNAATGKSFSAFPFLEYLHGLASLNKLDTTAGTYFKKFLDQTEGDSHIKSAWQKLAWQSFLTGDTIGYYQNMSKAEALGSSLVDADKQAQKEAESNRLPNLHLLRARLLFDGAYYQRALDTMSTLKAEDFVGLEDRTEYLYRMGRVNQELNKADSALSWYAQAIETGRNLPRYFAANAAYESGRIYESQGQKEKAKQLYTTCMSFENHEYKNGLDQKAKAALNRLR